MISKVADALDKGFDAASSDWSKASADKNVGRKLKHGFTGLLKGVGAGLMKFINPPFADVTEDQVAELGMHYSRCRRALKATGRGLPEYIVVDHQSAANMLSDIMKRLNGFSMGEMPDLVEACLALDAPTMNITSGELVKSRATRAADIVQRMGPMIDIYGESPDPYIRIGADDDEQLMGERNSRTMKNVTAFLEHVVSSPVPIVGDGSLSYNPGNGGWRYLGTSTTAGSSDNAWASMQVGDQMWNLDYSGSDISVRLSSSYALYRNGANIASMGALSTFNGAVYMYGPDRALYDGTTDYLQRRSVSRVVTSFSVTQTTLNDGYPNTKAFIVMCKPDSNNNLNTNVWDVVKSVTVSAFTEMGSIIGQVNHSPYALVAIIYGYTSGGTAVVSNAPQNVSIVQTVSRGNTLSGNVSYSSNGNWATASDRDTLADIFLDINEPIDAYPYGTTYTYWAVLRSRVHKDVKYLQTLAKRYLAISDANGNNLPLIVKDATDFHQCVLNRASRDGRQPSDIYQSLLRIVSGMGGLEISRARGTAMAG